MLPSIGTNSYEQDRNIPNNHREAYGPLQQPKTYNQFVYPLISSSYASMKIQGNNKNNVFNSPKLEYHPNLFKTSPHQFPLHGDINGIDLIPDYNSNAVITNPTSTSTTTSSYMYELDPEEEDQFLPSLPDKTATTLQAPRIQISTTIKPRLTTKASVTTTTPTPEEADSIFNKFLMEIFQTEDLEQIDNKIKKSSNMTEGQTTKEVEQSIETTELPTGQHNEYHDNMYFDYDEAALHNDSVQIKNKTNNFFDYYYPEDYHTKPIENVTSIPEKSTTLTFNLTSLVPRTTKFQIEVTTESVKKDVLIQNVTEYDEYDNEDYKDFYNAAPMVAQSSPVNGHQNFNISKLTTVETPTQNLTLRPKNPLAQLLANEKPTNPTTSTPSPFVTNMIILTSTNRPMILQNHTLSLSLVPPLQEQVPQTNFAQNLGPLLGSEEHNYHTTYHNADSQMLPRPIPNDNSNAESEIFTQLLPNDNFLPPKPTNYFPQVVGEQMDYYSRPLENSFPILTKTEAEANVTSQKINRANNQTYPQKEKINDKILALNSQPMYHQLPTDLTPPLEDKLKTIRPRPMPWETRPELHNNGYHLHKPSADENLPNILPQFRPNAKVSYGHAPDNVGTIHNKRRPPYFGQQFERRPNIPQQSRQQLRIVNDASNRRVFEKHNTHSGFETNNSENLWGHLSQEFQNSPPRIPDTIMKLKENNEVSTLQMIKSQHGSANLKLEPQTPQLAPQLLEQPANSSEFPLYVVYPTNHTAMSVNVFANNANSEKSTQVVVGKRTEQPIPPSQIEPDVFQNPFPTPKKTENPLLSDFPYRIERPNATFTDDIKYITLEENQYLSGSEKVSVVNSVPVPLRPGGVILGNGAEIPSQEHIAIAYKPTERTDIYQGNIIKNMGTVYGNTQQNEFTVSAVMHTAQPKPPIQIKPDNNHKPDLDIDKVHQQIHLDFQAPFQASASVESVSPHQQERWAVIPNTFQHIPHRFQDFPNELKDRMDEKIEAHTSQLIGNQNPTTSTNIETTSTMPVLTGNKEFDFENFKPQLFGGFKPIIKLMTNAPDNSEAHQL